MNSTHIILAAVVLKADQLYKKAMLDNPTIDPLRKSCNQASDMIVKYGEIDLPLLSLIAYYILRDRGLFAVECANVIFGAETITDE